MDYKRISVWPTLANDRLTEKIYMVLKDIREKQTFSYLT